MLYFAVGTIMHGYNMIEQSVIGDNNCTGPNYCKALNLIVATCLGTC